MFNIDSEFPTRLLDMRKTHSMTQTELAKAVGITQRQIAAYEAGSANPREKTLFTLAYHLGVTPSWLANGNKENSSSNWDKYTPKIEVSQIPLYSITDIEKIVFLNEEPHYRLHPCFIAATDEAYAFRMVGDAMEIDQRLGFPHNSIVTVDSNYKFTNGGFYLIIINNVITFKQVFRDELKTTLRSLNPNYPDSTYNNNEYKILSKAIYVEIDLDNRV